MEMEDLELEELDIGASILSRFSTSSDDDHCHLCRVVGAMAQELKDKNVSLTPLAYFGATVSSLDRILPSASGPDYSVGALVCFLELVIPRVPIGIRRKKGKQFMELLVRVLRGYRLSSNAIASGVNCVSSLLVTRDSDCCWDDVAQFYGVVLSFITDSDPKVRRQSHECIRDVLESFQRTPLIGPASEALTSLFQRLLLLTSESGAQEILHVLEALKDCLPYISMKYKTVILKYYKTLLERVARPPVTRRVTDSLNVLCLHQSQDVSAEVLADLLGLLAKSVAREETSADGLTFIARLLDVGMRKVHTLNRQICIDKLPAVLNALQDVFGSGFQEPKFAATEAMKSLLQTCVDEELIKLGVDHIKNNSFLKVKKSSPSIIERICATIGSLIDNSYRNEWDMAFQVLSVMFHKLGKSSSVLLRGSLESLASIANEGVEGFSEIKQLQECMGSALQSLGPEVFLSIVPLNLKADNLSEVNDWLFPILKHYTIGARLRFYVESLMDMVGYLKDKSHKLKLEGRVQSSRIVDTLVYHVWSLLPSFCNYPVDTNESFNLLGQILCNAINDEPDLHGIISSSLQILIQQNKSVIEGSKDVLSEKTNVSTERAISYYNHEVASANLSVLKSSARKFMSVISKVFLKSTNDPGGSLLITINEFASIANKDVVSRFFMTTLKKLLDVAEEDAKGSEKFRNSMQIDNSSNENSLSRSRAHLFDLAVSLLPGLGIEEIDVLFLAIVPALKDGDELVQKKAYKALSVTLKNSDGFIARKLEEMLKLMIEVLPSCHFSAKRHRLDCLYYLIVHAAKHNAEQKKVAIISDFLTEIVLALKEANKKTRNRAYDILVQIGHACEDEDKGGNAENLLQFFNMVAAGLAGEEPHMISAAVKGLARLAYEFSDLVSTAYNILPSTFLLLKRKNREIIKANLGLMKVLVAKSPADNLQNYLSIMVEGLLSWQDEKKNYFKAKVKHLLEMLIKKCGLDAVKAVMPEEHMKLLTNIRKIKERKDRKLAANSETRSFRSKATTRQSEWGHTKVFSDFDDETSNGDYMDAETAGGRRSLKLKSKASSIRSRKTPRSAKSSSEDMIHHLEDEPLDLLDQQNTRRALRSGRQKRKHDSDDELELDDEGRLIVHEGEKSRRDNKNKSSEYESDEERDKIEVGSRVSRNSSKKAQKRQKTSDSGFAYTGKEYGSKKARGDVKKKGKLEPYAYWPLDRKMLSKRPEHKAAAKRGMARVVKLTKKMEGRSVASALSLRSKKMKRSNK